MLMFYHTHLFVFPLKLQHFLKTRTPQETSTGHIIDQAGPTDCMLCKSLHQLKWQYLKREKHARGITFQLNTVWIDAAKSHIIF